MVTADAIKLVVFDWAGTTIDHGCFGPVAAFVQAFAARGVEVTAAEARGPMGLHKKDHLRAMLQNADVADRWRRAHGRDWSEADVADLYNRFIPLQMQAIEAHVRLIPGVRECVAELRRRGIWIGATTGYFREAAERVCQAAREQGFEPDCCQCAEDVPAGRPAPWMIFRIMETLDIYPPAAVLKVGDTVPDMAEGRNAGAWSIGVVWTGSEIGLSEAALATLSEAERHARYRAAEAKLRAAGAHAVLPSVADLPAWLATLRG